MKRFCMYSLLSFAVVLHTSCKKLIQFHPNEVRLEEVDRNLNAKNLARLAAEPPKNSFRFAVIGDSQRFYDELADFVNYINRYDDISFVLLNGDITDFGLNREYNWISRELRKLKMPFLAVIGNHDMLANGRVIYQQMFGPENFSFDYNGTRFIGINTNSREVGFNGSIPDTAWLRKAVRTNNTGEQSPTFVFSHVPPTSADFDPQLTEPFAHILAGGGNVSHSIHAHEHNFSRANPYGAAVEYVVVGSLNKRSFAIVNVHANKTEVEEVHF